MRRDCAGIAIQEVAHRFVVAKGVAEPVVNLTTRKVRQGHIGEPLGVVMDLDVASLLGRRVKGTGSWIRAIGRVVPRRFTNVQVVYRTSIRTARYGHSG